MESSNSWRTIRTITTISLIIAWKMLIKLTMILRKATKRHIQNRKKQTRKSSIWAGLSILLQQFVQFVNNVADCYCWTVYVLLPCFDERRTWLCFHFWTNGFNFKGLSVSNGCSEMKVRSSVRRWSARKFFPVWSRCLQIFWKSHPIFSQSTPNASTSTLVWSLWFPAVLTFLIESKIFRKLLSDI